MLQESSSSHNIPHVALPVAGDSKSHHSYPQQTLPYSLSNSSDLCCVSPTHSSSTPQLKKKFSSADSTAAVGLSSKRIENSSLATKHQSFDYASGKGK